MEAPETEEKPYSTVKHYYVDEAGDAVLFSSKGAIAFEKEGCSRYFFIGLTEINDHHLFSEEINLLRTRLLSDPYFQNIPSMTIGAKKTALRFHAKDDIPEVRHEVYKLIRRWDIRFFAVVKDKRALLDYVKERNRRETNYRYNQNELYDYLVRCLFSTLLHKAEKFNVIFSQRGKTDRNKALRAALHQARSNFSKNKGIICSAPIQVEVAAPEKMAGLQAVDYFLWALQRLYLKREDRYFNYISPLVHLIRDIDDTRRNRYGEYYTVKNQLLLEKIKPEI
jgi:hypothetical protein